VPLVFTVDLNANTYGTNYGNSLTLTGSSYGQVTVGTSGDTVTVNGGEYNQVATRAGLTAAATIDLNWDYRDEVTAVSGAGATTVTGGNSDYVKDYGNSVTFNGGSADTLLEGGNLAVDSFSWGSGNFVTLGGSGNAVTLTGEQSDTVTDSGTGNTLTLQDGSGTSITETGSGDEISLNWESGTSVTVSGGSNLVDFIGSANDTLTLEGLASGTNEFVNFAGYSAATQTTTPGLEDPSGASSTIDVESADVNLYIWAYQDQQGDFEVPVITGTDKASASIVYLGPMTTVGSMISAAAAFAFDASSSPDVTTLDRHHESVSLAASSHA